MKKILVVEDDMDIADTLQFILTRHGYSVRLHSTGMLVPEMVKEYTPDLVLLDIALPGKQGTVICEEIKDLNYSPPIILFSAHADEKSIMEKSRANGFIKKPFEISHLLKMIHSFVVQ